MAGWSRRESEGVPNDKPSVSCSISSSSSIKSYFRFVGPAHGCFLFSLVVHEEKNGTHSLREEGFPQFNDNPTIGLRLLGLDSLNHDAIASDLRYARGDAEAGF